MTRQKTTIVIKQYPGRKSLLAVIFLFTFALLFSLFSPIVSVHALSGITITPITTIAVLDSNDSCQVHKPAPSAMYVEVQVTNTSGSAINNLTASISNFTTTPSPLPAKYLESWGLAGGETAPRTIGTLAAGATASLFWFVNYPCYDGTLGNTGASLNYTITVSNGTVPDVTQNGSIVMRGEQSAAAGGVLYSEQIGAGAVVGQIIKVTDVYSFGNTGANQTINIQPVGNFNRPVATDNFNAGCFRLIGVDITALSGAWTGIDTINYDNRLSFNNVSASSTNNHMTVDYYFYALCTTSSGTIALPYSDLGSGTQFKYLSNFGTCSSTPCQYTLPVVSNAFTISKTANPTLLISGGTVTYTVIISNTSAYPVSIDSIQDVLPASTSYIDLTAGSQVTAANSSSIPTPGTTGTIRWEGKPATSCAGGCNNSYQIAANGSLTLQYTVSIPNIEGTYTNSVTALAGTTTLGPTTSTVTVGKLTPSVTTTIHDATHATVTSVPAGTTVHDSATVSGSGPTPTGTVDFSWYTTPDCTGTAVGAGNVILSGGVAHPSSSEGPLAAGLYSFKAHYNGDSNYKADDSSCEPLNVLLAPSITKSFGAATIPLNGTTALTFTITNPNAGTALTGVAFTDTLPTGLSVITGSAPQCGGTLNITAPGTIALTGGSIAAGGDCSFDVTVTGTAAGIQNNTTGNVTSTNGGTGSTASASITIEKASPTISTILSTSSISAGDSAYDTSTLSNATANAGGSVTYTIYLDSACTLGAQPAGTKIVINGSVPDSDVVTFNATGTYYWQAVYSGDAFNNAASSECTSEVLTVTVSQPMTGAKVFNPEIIKAGENTDLGIWLYAPADIDLTSVSLTDYLPAGFIITNSSPAYVVCESGVTGNLTAVTGSNVITWTNGMINAGSYCRIDVFVTGTTTGTFYNTIDRLLDVSNDQGRPLASDLTYPILVNKATPTVTTTLSSESILVGDPVYDTAVISGASATAGGTLTYTVYTDAICTLGARSAGTKMVTNGSVPNSDSLIFNSSSTYYWQAAYSGDGNNEPAVSECTSEILTVGKAAPTLTTSLSASSVIPGSPVYDTASLSNGSANAGGTVTYTVYTDDACTLGARSAGTKTVTNGVITDSDALIFNTAGTYYWQAVYSGDANNEPATSDCSSEILTVGKLTPAITTTIHDNSENAVTTVITGSIVHDSATVTGTAGYPEPTGTVSFAWFPNNTCTGASSDAGTVSLAAGTAHPSTSQGPLAAGSYSFKAFYNGDSIYEATESACEPLTVSDFSATVSKDLVASNWPFSTPLDRVAIGEIVTYETSFNVPAGSIENLKLTDTLDAGLAYVSCEGITGPTTLTCATIPTVITALPDASAEVNIARQVEFGFGTVNNSSGSAQDLIVRYRVVVLDSAGNLRGKALNNSAVWSWNSTDPANPNIQAAQPVAVVVIEPSLNITKSISPIVIAKGGVADVTIVISHTGASNQSAFDVEWSDPLPAGLTYVPGSLTFSGQLPTSSNDSSLPNLSATWNELTLAGAPATITFKVTVNLNPGVSATNSTAVAWTSLPGDLSAPQSANNLLSHERFYDPASPIDIYTVSASSSVTVASTTLPGTGFTPGRMTILPIQPEQFAYTDTGSLYLEIPSLHKFLKIVGVPQSSNGWDVTWLGNQAGYLQGTAFPTWKGNSVITAHVYDTNGKPGPFINLSSLRWGDRIIIHAFGTKYIYEVRGVVRTTANDSSLLKHEDYPWVTLITCQGYNAKTDSYAYRIGVRAVLIDSQPE